MISVASVEDRILLLRGHRLMLDRDLASLYGVTTGNLNKAVDRNLDRFPNDFMFQLTKNEFENLNFHFGTSSWGGTRKLPYAFTEQGVPMLSSVLRSKRAVKANILIMRAFVRLRGILATNKEFSSKLAELERKLEGHDESIRTLFEAIRHLLKPPDAKRRKIGFEVKEGRVTYRVRRSQITKKNQAKVEV